MAISFPRVAGSRAAPRESTPTPASGERRGSDRDLCYVISIGCTTSTCNTTHPPSIRIHSNRNPRAATRSFPSGFRIQMATRSAINSSSNGYVELPYTLPQDFTLFVLLQEKTPEIWMRKLDWIAQHGGMALVDVHPDYLCFDNATTTSREYPAAHYKSFLDYVSQRYSGAFWNTTPRQVAQFCTRVTQATRS